jgi:hypothetical protein
MENHHPQLVLSTISMAIFNSKLLVITRGYKDLVKIRAIRLQGRARETPIVLRARSYKASAGVNSDGIR